MVDGGQDDLIDFAALDREHVPAKADREGGCQ